MALRVLANLQCELDGQLVAVHSEAQKIVVEVPDVATGLKLLPLGSPRDFERFSRVLQTVDRLGLTVELRTGTYVLFAAGHNASSWLMCRLGIRHLRPSLRLLLQTIPLLVRLRLRLSK